MLAMLVNAAQQITSIMQSIVQLLNKQTPETGNMSQRNYRVLLDGYGWRPLSGEWDYDATDKRIAEEVFSAEFEAAFGA